MLRVAATNTGHRRARQTGAAIAELVLVLPMLLLVGLSTIQFALIYEARATLNYAALMAARAGATGDLGEEAMRRAFARAMVPLYSPNKDAGARGTAYAMAYLDARTQTIFQVLNPTTEAFDDFAIQKPGANVAVIPNDRLHIKSSRAGARSGVNIQDANLLKLNIVYGYELKVPFAGPIIARVVSWSNPFRGYERVRKGIMLQTGRLPIQSNAIVRMQSDARAGNRWVKSRVQVDKQLADTKIQPSQFVLPGRESRRAWHAGPTGSDW